MRYFKWVHLTILIFSYFRNFFIIATDDGRDSELDLELRLGPNDSSKGSHIINDKHDTVPQAGQKRKRYDATRLTLSTNMNLTQKAKQDATHTLTKMERYELRLEKKRLYMREKKRKLEEMVS